MTIRNDATRSRIVPEDERRLRAVAARQGQVLLDADLNANTAHVLDRIETETTDLLAPPGRLAVPAGSAAFRLSPGATLADTAIGAGHAYLDGWLLDAGACTLATQPHPPQISTVAGPFAFVLKALLRHIDPAEEPVLADSALGDAVAPGRVINDWQVIALPLPGYSGGCAGVTGTQAWHDITGSDATAELIQGDSTVTGNACSLTPSGGYTRLENLLYRIEVEGGTNPVDTADGQRFGLQGLRLKLSRRNGSVMARITSLAAATGEFRVAPALPDPVNWFAPGRLAEIVSPHDELTAPTTARLFRVAGAGDDLVTLDATQAEIDATGAATGWALRLWELWPDGAMLAVAGAAEADGLSPPVSLGDGLSIRLGGTRFRRGDHWTFSARADGTTDWPDNTARPADGPAIRYCPLGIVPATGAATDCRVPFTRASDVALLYRGGDGQAIFPPPGGGLVALPAQLRVAAMLGQVPVAGARIEWRPVAGALAGRIAAQVPSAASPAVTLTGPDGLSAAGWEIDAGQPQAAFRLQAQLVIEGAPIGPPVEFSAGFLTAASTGLAPTGCSHLQGIGDVQAALQKLCNLIGAAAVPETLQLQDIALLGKSGKETPVMQDDLILNGLEVPASAMLEGVRFMVNQPLGDMAIAPWDPVSEITLDLPYPDDDASRLYYAELSPVRQSFGTRQLRLSGTIKIIQDNGSGFGEIIWTADPPAQEFLVSARSHGWGLNHTRADGPMLDEWQWNVEQADRVLCRLRLRSALIWGISKTTDKRIYLNAEHLGTKGTVTRRELLTHLRDPQMAADLDMFIYLTAG